MSYFSNRPMYIDLSKDYCCATIQGPDASAFLQSQIACDVAAIPPLCARWTCWVDAHGKVRALGHLANLDENRWAFVAHASFSAALKKLAMYVLRAKVQLAYSNAIWGVLGGQPGAKVAGIDADRGLTFTTPAGVVSDDVNFWRAIAAIHGEAQFDAERSSSEIPQSLGLQVNHGFSLTKGCYPGQEIISRVHYRGHPPRKMVTTLAKTAPEDAVFALPLDASGLIIAQSLRAWSA